MRRDDVVEALARAECAARGLNPEQLDTEPAYDKQWERYIRLAESRIRSIEAVVPGLQDVIDGTSAIVSSQ